MPPRRAHGSIGGNGSTRFSILNLRQKSWFHRKWRNSQRSARTQDAKKTGNEATNCARKFPHSAGKHATRRTDKNSRDAGVLGSARVPRVGERVSRSRTLLNATSDLKTRLQEKFVAAGHRNQTRETRALPAEFALATRERFVILNSENVCA